MTEARIAPDDATQDLRVVPQPSSEAFAMRKLEPGENAVLDPASLAYLYDAMYSQDAQDAFRDGGERRYQDFVRHRLAAAPPHVPQVSQFAEPQYWGGQPVRMRPPMRPSAGGAVPAPPTTKYPKKIIPDPATAHAADQQELAIKEQAFKGATDAYALVTAQRRASYGDALLIHENSGARWQRIGRRVVATVLSPFERSDHRDAERLQQESLMAADVYGRTLDDYLAVAARDAAGQFHARVAAMQQFEARVRGYMGELTYSRRDDQGNLVRTRGDERRGRLADFWFNGTKARRVGIIALSGAVIGVPAGIVVGAALAPWWVATVVGIGAAYAGRVAGGEIARAVNRYQGVSAANLQRLENEARSRNEAFANTLQPHSQSNAVQPDVVPVYEAGTLHESRINLRRMRYARVVGGLAAAGAFGLANWLSGSARVAAEQSMQHAVIQPHPQPTQTLRPAPNPPTPTPNVPPTPTPPHVNVHDFPWNVAHQLKPGHEFDLINHAIGQYNAANHTHLKLVSHAFGTQWTQIENGALALNPVQQTNFNIFMAAHAA